MKQGKNVLEQLKASPYFTKEMVAQLGESYGLAPKTTGTVISRALRKKAILPLKRGFYVSADFYDEHKKDPAYLFSIANILRRPSYVSSWTALQHYGLATEAIRTIISVTPKVTRTYDTKIGTFSYSSISEKLFTGFELREGATDYFIATPAKALFDLLYFKTKRFKNVSYNDVPALVSELRVDMDEMDAQERSAFLALVKDYLCHE